MSEFDWFDGLDVLGNLPPEKAAAKLREFGEEDAADAVENAQGELDGSLGVFESVKDWWPFRDRAWQHTAHAFGYLPPVASSGRKALPIRHAGNIKADRGLRDARLKVTLDRLRVADYPGGGTHRVLFDFYAQNQVSCNVEHVHFNMTCRVRQSEHAAIVGYPVFVGLNVGEEGLALRGYTVNVRNEADEKFLSFLESDAFREGLKLATTMQPAIKPLSKMAVGLTRAIASRHRNVPVQDFYMGLDFSQIPMRAHLAEGAYLAVQIPESLHAIWDWNEWMYDVSNGQVVGRQDSTRLIPYNYLVFSVSRCEGD